MSNSYISLNDNKENLYYEVNEFSLDFWLFVYTLPINLTIAIKLNTAIGVSLTFDLNSNNRATCYHDFEYNSRSILYFDIIKDDLSKWLYFRCSISTFQKKLNFLTASSSQEKNLDIYQDLIEINKVSFTMTKRIKNIIIIKELRVFNKYLNEDINVNFNR